MVAAIDTTTSDANKVTPVDHVALAAALLSDTVDLVDITRGISFATAGALKIITAGGETVVIPSGALAAGIMHPIRASRIFNTGTAAAGIVIYW